MNLVTKAMVAMGNSTTPTTVVYENLFLPDIRRHSLRLNFDTPISRAEERLEAIRFWGEGWNGHDVAAPNSVAIDHALVWLKKAYESIWEMSKSEKSRGWVEPHITASEDGDVLFEWWNSDKGLSIYISEIEVSYIKDWGVNIQDEMEDGTLSTPEDIRELWAWMFGPSVSS